MRYPVASAAGNGVLIGPGLFGVAPVDSPEGMVGPLAVTGVFDLPKAAGEIAPGAKLFWDNANRRLTTTASGNPYVGAATIGAAVDAATVQIRLNGATI
ncbi:DUF2190 family protein [Sphingomonas sp. IW22]|uniref:DUF2190 family protein n=1 Tax=Sphingomonas sp. IW22 TaxID=3242489 RepID=UPI003521BBA2